MKDTTIVIRSTEEFKKEVEKYAVGKGLSVSSFVRMILMEEIKKKP